MNSAANTETRNISNRDNVRSYVRSGQTVTIIENGFSMAGVEIEAARADLAMHLAAGWRLAGR